MTPEGRVKAGVLKYLKLRRIKAWSNPSGAVRIRPGKFMSFGLKGSADILGCLPDGRFLAVEVKAARGCLSPEQRDFMASIKALGGLAVTVRGWRELADILREAGYVAMGPLFEGIIEQGRTAPDTWGANEEDIWASLYLYLTRPGVFLNSPKHGEKRI
jgi:hypothetical protein